MSEKVRQAVWEEIKASELVGSDVVPLPIETVKLLLECARLVNEGASTKPFMNSQSTRFPIKENLISNQELRDRCEELAEML